MDRIRKLRKECGISQKTMASELGMLSQNYWLIEHGRWIPNDIEDIKAKAVKFLMPLLVQKIMTVREDLNRLEWLSTQFK